MIVFKQTKPFIFYHDDLVLDGGRKKLIVPTDLVILGSGFHGDLKLSAHAQWLLPTRA
jgi:hypothetical protein